MNQSKKNKSLSIQRGVFQVSVDQMYGKQRLPDEEVEILLKKSLTPRGPELLFEKMAGLSVDKENIVLDIGGRDGKQACELVRKFGCKVISIDPVKFNIEKANKLIRKGHFNEMITVRSGSMDATNCLSESIDVIWIRDVTNHVSDLYAGFEECRRILKPGGKMVIFQTFETQLMEPNEARLIYSALATNPKNMSSTYFEKAFKKSGFKILEKDVIAGEWREFAEEGRNSFTSKQLLFSSRLVRNKQLYINRIGRRSFHVELANCLWGIYQMIGKLCPIIYSIQKQ